MSIGVKDIAFVGYPVIDLDGNDLTIHQHGIPDAT